MNFINQLVFKFRSLPPVTRTLLSINIIVFILDLVSPLFRAFAFNYLALYPYRTIFLGMVWQPLTYMFVHGGLFHIFFNMFLLLIAGRELEVMWGSRRYLWFYMLSGLGGAALILFESFILTGNITTPTVGASAALSGLLIFYGLIFSYRKVLVFFFFPMNLGKFIAVFFIVSFALVALSPVLPPSFFSRISHSGHLGGMITGLIFIYIFRKENYFVTAWQSLLTMLKQYGLYSERSVRPKKQKNPFKVFSSNKAKTNENEMTDSEIEENIDLLLEKISKKGLSSLSIEERLFLDRVSQSFRYKFPD